MRNFALLGASALILALGVASASAQPSGQAFLTRGETNVVSTYAPTVHEGRAAAIDAPAPSANAFNLSQHHAGR